MIKREFYLQREDGVNLYRTYSDEGLYIKQDQTDIEYNEAIDIETAPYTYTETDKYIEGDGINVPDAKALAEIMEVVQ